MQTKWVGDVTDKNKHVYILCNTIITRMYSGDKYINI